MSKLSDYGKFDNLDTDSEVEEEMAPSAQAPSTTSGANPLRDSAKEHMERNPKTKRFIFSYEGNRIYEWEQKLSEVLLYVPAPPPLLSQRAKFRDVIDCNISARRIQLGLRGSGRYFIDEATGGDVIADESTICLEDVDTEVKGHAEKMIVLYLQKAHKGEVWDCVLKGGTVRLKSFDLETIKKEILLERFGEENPGFDFEGAQVNGSVSDPRTFLGGPNYQ